MWQFKALLRCWVWSEFSSGTHQPVNHWVPHIFAWYPNPYLLGRTIYICYSLLIFPEFAASSWALLGKCYLLSHPFFFQLYFPCKLGVLLDPIPRHLPLLFSTHPAITSFPSLIKHSLFFKQPSLALESFMTLKPPSSSDTSSLPSPNPSSILLPGVTRKVLLRDVSLWKILYVFLMA